MMTVAANVLLERTGERTVLAVSKGFTDLLHIRDQTLAEIFDLQSRGPKCCTRLCSKSAREWS